MSRPVSPLPPINGLLAIVPRAERDLILNACDPVDLIFGDSVCQPGDSIRHVYFPTDSYISLIAPAGASEDLEVGMIGNEGMFGITLLLDVRISALAGLVQGGGPALRMSAARFGKLANEHASFRRTLNRYLYVLTAELAQTAACNRFHHLDARMARWLLMTHDRALGSTFRLTHKFLAYMLGVRRAGVSEAAGRLQAQGLIQYAHGELTVLNRPALELASCGCYDVLQATYRQHLGTRGKSRVQEDTKRRIRELPS
jgi:CRP-like cAMP-binding protein